MRVLDKIGIDDNRNFVTIILKMLKMKQGKVGLNSIASKCNLSKMTVGRVLRNDPYVAQETRHQVLEMAERLNYIPSRYKYNQTGSVSSTKNYFILFQKEFSLKDVFFSEIIRSIQHELFDSGAVCSFGVIKEKYVDFLKLYNILKSADPDGLIVVNLVPDNYLNTLIDQFRTLILVDNPGSSKILKPYNAVFYDNKFGSALAVNHLVKLGRKKILFICGDPKHYFSQELLQGYQNTLLEHDIEFDEKRIFFADFHIMGGYRAAKKALETGVEFDALFSNDEMAFGAMKALKEHGLNVPADVSVVGFDGLAIGENTHPSLTTLFVDREKMGVMAARRLLDMEKDVPSGNKFEKIVLFPELLVRESCGFKRFTQNGKEWLDRTKSTPM